MRREWRERFPRHRFQRKPLVSDPSMHHCTCVTHVPWCMSGSLTRGVGENVPVIPGACATRIFTYLARDPCTRHKRFDISNFQTILYDEWYSFYSTISAWQDLVFLYVALNVVRLSKAATCQQDADGINGLVIMMTSWYGYTFLIEGSLCGEFIGYWSISSANPIMSFMVSLLLTWRMRFRRNSSIGR